MPVIPRSAERPRLPDWMKRRLSPLGSSHNGHTNRVLRKHALHTVCEEATCPNRNECYSKRVATFMLMGDICTRTCSFCDVTTGNKYHMPPLDAEEPERVAAAVAELGLRFAVLTSVNRDDLPDGGAGHFATTIRAIQDRNPGGRVEVLTPDFEGDEEALATVLAAGPTVFNHNLETIPRLYRTVRPQADYRRSLRVLARAKAMDPAVWTKSGIMVGLGETDEEVRWVLEDLRAHDVDIVTIGQYLRPSLNHHDILRFVTPEQFATYRRWGDELGFAHVAAGPYVRSSYIAEAVLEGAIELKRRPPAGDPAS
ncbi:MAG: lipoyl synthase [Planctomycetota bacterium]